MKQYDHLYVPSDSFGMEIKLPSGEWDTIQEQKNVIVLTIEELSALWNAGYRAGYSDLGKETRTTAVDFETYLQSKGINLHQ